MADTRRCIASIVGVGAVATTAVLAGAQPAGATEVVGSKSISFIDTGGRFVTCNVFDDANRFTNRHLTVTYHSELVGGAGDCGATVAGQVTFRDSSGGAHTVGQQSESGTHFLQMTVDQTYTPVTTSFHVIFDSCDAGRSTSCDLTVTANPK